MKKGLLYAGTVLFSASAFAAPVAETAPSRAFDADILKMMSTSVVKNQVRYSAPNKIVTPDKKFEICPTIIIPQTPFYGGGLINKETGTFAPVPVPANVPVLYKGGSVVYRADGVKDRFEDWDKIKYEWNYRNPVTWEESSEWIEGKQIAVNYAQLIDFGTFPMPNAIATYNEEVEETAAPYKIIFSGTPTVPLSDGNGGVALEDIGFTTMPSIEGITNEENYSPEALFGKQTFTDSETTYSQSTIDKAMNYWADAFEETTGEPLKEMKIKGLVQALPYGGSPYLLKSLTFLAYLWTEKDLTFDLTLYEMDENYQPTDRVIYQSKFTVEANADEATHKPEQLRMDLQHQDADGWTIDYVRIDCPVLLKVSGFEDNAGVVTFWPMAWGYDYDEPYCYVVDTTAGVLYDMIGEKGKTIDNYACYNRGAWGHDDVHWYFHHAFAVEVEAEYPILQPTDYFIGENEGVTMEYKEDGIYDINIEEGVSEVAVAIATSASDIDEIIADFEEDGLPEWIEKIEIMDGIHYQTQSGAFLNFIEVHFALKGDYTGKSFAVPFTYKTQNIQVGISNSDGEDPGPGAVDNIVIDQDSQFYDLQGRKLNGTPEKGVYILKNGVKTSKVIL